MLRAIEENEQLEFTSFKYNKDKVKQLLNVADSVAEDFILHHAMPVELAVQSGDLAINNWIMKTFLTYKKSISARKN